MQHISEKFLNLLTFRKYDFWLSYLRYIWLFMIESHVSNPVEQQEIHESTKYGFEHQTCSRYFSVHKIIDERMSVVKGN